MVESDPAGATVTLSNGMTGKTPASFKLPRRESLLVTIEREGYEPVDVHVIPQVCREGGAGMAGNVCLGGCIGAGVDIGTGAMKDLKPNPISVKLVKLPAEEVTPEAPSQDRNKDIMERLRELEQLRDEGTITEEEYQKLRSKTIEQF